MKSLLLAAAAVLYAAAAQAEPVSDPLAQGRELRLAGHADQAIPLLQAATQAAPKDADAWLNLGLAYTAAHRYADAERALAQAQALAPAYADVSIARARLAFFQGDAAEAQRRLAPLLAAEPDNADAKALALQLSAARTDAAPAWRLDARLAQARLSKGLPSQTLGVVALAHTDPAGRTLSASVEQARQFDRSDTYLEAQLGGRRGYLALGGAFNADFRPEWQVRGGASADPWTLQGGWTAQLAVDGSWARYPVGDVRSLQPSLTLAKGDDLLLIGRWINTLDERDDYRSGYALRAIWKAAPALRLSVGWADAPESSEGVTQNVRAASFGLAVDVRPTLTLRLDGVHEMRSAYDRDELAVGLTRRF